MKILTQEHQDYPTACLGWNRAIQQTPATIAFCQTEADIQVAIRHAQAAKQKICVRSGRHHYEGDSWATDSFVIDVAGLQTIVLDEVQQTVTIGAGVRNRELYEKLATAQYPFPGGGCPTVGVVGFTLGGGWGYSSRYLGLACDSLVAAKIILWDGTVLTVDETKHADLFWSLRGGGIDVGVVSEMTYRLPAKALQATKIFLDYHFDTADAAIALLAWYQEWFPTLPNLINLKAVLYRNREQQFGVKFTGIAYADEVTTAQLLVPLRQFVGLRTDDCTTGPVIEANRWIQDHHPDFEYYKSGGRFLARGLTHIQWQTLCKWLEQIPSEATYAAFTLYGLGGAVKDLNMEATAFAYRDMQFIFGSQIVWEDPQATPICRDWLIRHWPAIETITSGSFLNFPLHPQAEQNYYGRHFAKVMAIREQYRS